MFAVERSFQGKGLGSALLAEHLRLVDQNKMGGTSTLLLCTSAICGVILFSMIIRKTWKEGGEEGGGGGGGAKMNGAKPSGCTFSFSPLFGGG